MTITKAYTYDNDTNPSIHAGEDGKRQLWYIDLANEKENSVLFYIKNGIIDDIHSSELNSNNGLIAVEQLKMTSQEAVEESKKIGLRGGNPENIEDEWVSGYNFNLEWGSLVKSPDERRIFLTVIGISKNGNFAHVVFDAETKELVLAEEKIENKDGSVIWQEF